MLQRKMVFPLAKARMDIRLRPLKELKERMRYCAACLIQLHYKIHRRIVKKKKEKEKARKAKLAAAKKKKKGFKPASSSGGMFSPTKKPDMGASLKPQKPVATKNPSKEKKTGSGQQSEVTSDLGESSALVSGAMTPKELPQQESTSKLGIPQ